MTKLSLKVPVQIFKEGKTFVAHSPVLDVATSAASFELVKKRFTEAVQIFFEELRDLGTTDEVLSGLGWVKVKRQWNPPTPIAHDIENISVSLKQ